MNLFVKVEELEALVLQKFPEFRETRFPGKMINNGLKDGDLIVMVILPLIATIPRKLIERLTSTSYNCLNRQLLLMLTRIVMIVVFVGIEMDIFVVKVLYLIKFIFMKFCGICFMTNSKTAIKKLKNFAETKVFPFNFDFC